MALRFDMHGCLYDDAVPVFVNCAGGMVFDRIRHLQVTKASLMAYAARIGYNLTAPEIGEAPNSFKANNDWPNEKVASTSSGGVAPITATPNKTALTVTFAGGPLGAGDADQVTVTVAAGAQSVTHTITMAAGDTIAVAAATLAGLTWTPFTAAAAAGVVTFAKGTAAGAIDTLYASLV